MTSQRAAEKNKNDESSVETYRQSARHYRLLFAVTFFFLLCACGYVFIDKYADSIISGTNVIVSKSVAVHIEEENEVSVCTITDVDDFSDVNNCGVKRQQIENYRKGDALILNVHPTHHAGTSFCGAIGRNGINNSIAPRFACNVDKDEVMPNKTYGNIYHKYKPWLHDETGPNIAAVRPYFHMISWEYSGKNMLKRRTLEDTDWEHPKLVSVIITRDPISRLLAGDGNILKKYPGYNDGTLDHQGWWDYAKDRTMPNTDNFFLRIVGGEKWQRNNEHNNNINRTSYEHAVSVLNRFTFVLDIACLTEGLEVLARLLNLDDSNKKKSNKNKKPKKLSPEIGYGDVYNYLLEKNKWDIQLYEYSKNISLVRCNELYDDM